MQTFMTTTQVRNKMTVLTDVDEPIVISKNGIPASILLNYREWENMQKEKEDKTAQKRKRRTEILRALFKETDKNPVGEEWLKKNKLYPKDDEELLDLLYQEDENN